MIIKLTKLFSDKTEEVLKYLAEEHTESIKQQFLKKLNERVRILEKTPYAFPESSIAKGLRKLVVSKQTTIFYKVTEEYIFLVTLFDTRQNPDTIDNEIQKHSGDI